MPRRWTNEEVGDLVDDNEPWLSALRKALAREWLSARHNLPLALSGERTSPPATTVARSLRAAA